MQIRRCFLQVADRAVHYLRTGKGPPAVLVHSSPANAWLLREEMQRLQGDFTVFAFDTPGFGLSDPLPLEEMQVSDLADALADTLDAIGMPPCPMFGTHTGAAIALEFGVLYPERVTGLVLDGVPAFTSEEQESLFGDYFRPLPVTDLGGIYSEVWTRFRDQSIWFPWSRRRPENINEYDLGAPESTHIWALMFYDAADHYTPAYKAANRYGARAIDAAKMLKVPAVYTAVDTDMLYPHLDRLPPMNPGQEIRRIGKSYDVKRELIAEAFQRFGSPGAAPPDHDALLSSTQVRRQFIDGGEGRQLGLRYAGDRASPLLLLIHDAPGSSERCEPLIAALSSDYFVIAPDLPGHGASDRFVSNTPSIADFAAVLSGMLETLNFDAAFVYGIGFGSSVAVELARSHASQVRGLALRAIALPDEDERAELAARYAPDFPIERDGSHWYRMWLMLRDSLVYWPWYKPKLKALRRVDADFGARSLHRWTVDVMRRHDSYHHLIRAALAHDAAGAIADIACEMILIQDRQTLLSVYDDRLAALRPDARRLAVADDINAHVHNWSSGA